MNTETARALCDITSAFYRENAASFSSTRHASWAGWSRCLDAMGLGRESSSAASDAACPDASASIAALHPTDDAPAPSAPCTPATTAAARTPAARASLRVLDVACGNGRFLRFLREALPDTGISYLAVDNCEPLVSCGFEGSFGSVAFRRLDIAESLLTGAIDRDLPAPPADMAVCFGFFHHVPGASPREQLLRALVDRTRPGGYVAASFWQFAKSPELAKRARATTAAARDEHALPALDAGDYLLGWQNKPHAYRYCHSFSDGEVDKLARSVTDKAQLVARFEADGRTGAMNSYLVLRRRAE